MRLRCSATALYGSANRVEDVLLLWCRDRKNVQKHVVIDRQPSHILSLVLIRYLNVLRQWAASQTKLSEESRRGLAASELVKR